TGANHDQVPRRGKRRSGQPYRITRLHQPYTHPAPKPKIDPSSWFAMRSHPFTNIEAGSVQAGLSGFREPSHDRKSALPEPAGSGMVDSSAEVVSGDNHGQASPWGHRFQSGQ